MTKARPKRSARGSDPHTHDEVLLSLPLKPSLKSQTTSHDRHTRDEDEDPPDERSSGSGEPRDIEDDTDDHAAEHLRARQRLTTPRVS